MTERLIKNTAQVSDVVYCDFCGGDMKPEKVTMRYFRKGGAHLFRNVEAEVCQKCGEKYYHAHTLADLDRKIKLQSERAFSSPVAAKPA